MSRFVILRIAADGIYECIGQTTQGYENRGAALCEVDRLLRLPSAKEDTQLVIFEREAIYATELTIKRTE